MPRRSTRPWPPATPPPRSRSTAACCSTGSTSPAPPPSSRTGSTASACGCATARAPPPRPSLAAAEREGRHADAVAAARRGVELAADDEAALRRYVALLDRAGEHGAALRAYDDFARRLSHELDLEPSAETRALADALRARAERPRGRAVPPGAAPPASITGTESPGDPAATIAVLPFAVRGDPRLAYLGEGMVDLLATKLDGAGEIRTVDPRALLRALAGEGVGGVAGVDVADGGAAIARRFGAGRYLSGTIVEAGGRLRASASLYGLDGVAVATAEAAAAGEGELFELVDELALQLLAAQGVSAGTRLTRIAALTTVSLDALKAYLLGERELRAGRYFDAMEGFQAALDADPSFALAYYRLAAACAGCALPDVAREVADRGAEHQERLSPHDRLVFEAQRAWLHGAVERAEALYGTITGTYPEDVEAWFHLGDLLFHSNPLRGRSATEARGPFERVVRLEPGHVAAMVHLTRIAAIEGRRDEMLGLIERILRASPGGDQALAMRALRAWATRDASAITEVAAELQQARAITVAIAFADVALYAGNPAGAAEPGAGVPAGGALARAARALPQHAGAPGPRGRGPGRHAGRASSGRSARWHVGTGDARALRHAAVRAGGRGRAARGARRTGAVGSGGGRLERVPDLCDAQRPAPGHPGLPAGPARAAPGRPAGRRRPAGGTRRARGAAARWCGTSRSSSTRRWPTRAAARPRRSRGSSGRARSCGSSLRWRRRSSRSRRSGFCGRGCWRRRDGRQEAAGWYRSIAERSPYELVYARAAKEALTRLP